MSHEEGKHTEKVSGKECTKNHIHDKECCGEKTFTLLLTSTPNR